MPESRGGAGNVGNRQRMENASQWPRSVRSCPDECPPLFHF